jgi:O-antigen/teichoic acid export membrane protein
MTATSQPGQAAVTAERTPDRSRPGRSGTASALPHRFGRNVVMNYAAQGTAALSALILTPLLLHHLGKPAFGVWVLASSVVLYLGLFELGFGGATAKLVAEDAFVRPDQALRTLNTTFFALVPLGILALGAGVGVAFAFPSLVHVTPQLHDQVILVVVILAFGLTVSIPFNTFGGALIGHQRFDMLGLSNSLLVGSTLVASIIIVALGGGLIPLAIGLSTLALLAHPLRFWMLRRVLPGARISWHLADRARLREVLHVSGWFLLNAVLMAIYNACDVVVVGIVLGLRAAAVYAVAAKLATAAIQGLDSLAQVFFPYASSIARNESRQALADITMDGTRAVMFVGMIITVSYVVLASPGIRAWVGPGFGTSARVLVVLGIAIALSSPVRAISVVLLGAGRLPVICAIRGAEMAVNLALSVSLALVMGPVGVAFGTLGGIVLARLPGFLIIGSKAIGVRPLTVLRRAVLPHLLPVAASAAVLFVLRGVAGRSITELVVVGLAGTMTYVAVYFAFSATGGERHRALLAVNRFVPPRWRHDLEEFAGTGAPAHAED